MFFKRCFWVLFLVSTLTHVNAATSDQQIRDNLKRHSYSGNSAMNSIATEVGKLVTDNQLEQTWGDSFARTMNGTSHGFAKRQANQEDIRYMIPALAAIAVKNPKRDMWAELSRGNIRGFTPEQQEHILNAYTIITLFQKLNENGFLVKTGSIEEFYDEMFRYQVTEALDESFRKFGNDSLRAKVTLFVTHIFPFARYIPAIPEPSPAHYKTIHSFHKSFNPQAARSFVAEQSKPSDSFFGKPQRQEPMIPQFFRDDKYLGLNNTRMTITLAKQQYNFLTGEYRKLSSSQAIEDIFDTYLKPDRGEMDTEQYKKLCQTLREEFARQFADIITSPQDASFAAHHPKASGYSSAEIASQLERFKQEWNAYRQVENMPHAMLPVIGLGLPINRDPEINGYRTIFLREPRDGKGDVGYNRTKKAAEIWKVRGGGDCGFDAVGISREIFVLEALSRFNVDPDIKHALKNDFKGFVVDWAYQRPPEGRRYFSEKLNNLIEKTTLNAFDDTDNMPDADTKEFIRAYYLEKGDSESEEAQRRNNGNGFMTSAQAQEDGDQRGAVWRPEAGSLRVLAKIRGVNLRLWKRVDDKSRPAKFTEKRDLDYKRANGTIIESETQKLAELTEELDLSAYPWSYVEIDRDWPTLNIINGGNHYDVVLPEGDTQGFPHAFRNEVKATKAEPEIALRSAEIDKKIADLLAKYPAVK